MLSGLNFNQLQLEDDLFSAASDAKPLLGSSKAFTFVSMHRKHMERELAKVQFLAELHTHRKICLRCFQKLQKGLNTARGVSTLSLSLSFSLARRRRRTPPPRADVHLRVLASPVWLGCAPPAWLLLRRKGGQRGRQQGNQPKILHACSLQDTDSTHKSLFPYPAGFGDREQKRSSLLSIGSESELSVSPLSPSSLSLSPRLSLSLSLLPLSLGRAICSLICRQATENDEGSGRLFEVRDCKPCKAFRPFKIIPCAVALLRWETPAPQVAEHHHSPKLCVSHGKRSVSRAKGRQFRAPPHRCRPSETIKTTRTVCMLHLVCCCLFQPRMTR